MSHKDLVTDRLFQEIKHTVETATEEELIRIISRNYNNWAKTMPRNIVASVVDFHNRFQFWGKLEPRTNDISLIIQRAEILKNQWEKIECFYNRLEDYRSKYVLITVLKNWLTFSYEDIRKVKENCFKSYFDMDLLMCDEEEVVVDLGAWVGDTVEDYLHTYGKECYKKIYCYEILKRNINILHEKFDDMRELVIRPVGVSRECGEMYLSDNNTTDAQSLVENGTTKVETVTLDTDIEEKITLLKTDIEGAEYDALSGAREHIKNDKPKLAISIYHSNQDLIRIFELIEEIQPGYHFYLRYNGQPHFPSDYILIGLPPKA